MSKRVDWEPVRSPLRFLAAAACVISAAVHLAITEDHLQEATYIGVLFVLLSVALCIEAGLLIRRDSRLVWIATGTTGAMALAAYVWSRSVGLPQIMDDVGSWTEPLGVIAIASEALLVLLTIAALAGRGRSWISVRAPAVAGLALVSLGLVATAIAAESPAQEAAEASMKMNGSGMGHMATDGGSYWSEVAGAAFHSDGITRTYYISADPVVWDYAPDGMNEITGEPFDEVADTYVASGPGRIGSRYEKCLYHGYTDASFTRPIVRGPDESYLGLLGPVIRAEVGDTIKVVFRNKCSFPTSVHPHGVFYTKSSEGAPYNDGTSGGDKADDAVPTGGTYTYRWLVPERAGPGPGDGSSVMWMYHSHTEEIADTYAGLIGPMEITRRGWARQSGSPKDVDREVFALYSVMNENESPFLEENVHQFASPPEPDLDDEDFQESNLMHSVNGYVFGNMPMINLRRGERVRWYVMSLGTEVDLHTPHWHGNTATINGMRMDTFSLLPASMVVADMVPDDRGTWLFHCHVNDHIRAGMLTRYRVQ